MTAATTATRGGCALGVVVRARQLLVRALVTGGLAAAGWLLMLTVSAPAAAAEEAADAPEQTAAQGEKPRGGLLGGVVGSLKQTTSSLTTATVQTVQTVHSTTKAVQHTVKTVTDTVGSVTGAVRDTVGGVTKPVEDVVVPPALKPEPVQVVAQKSTPQPTKTTVRKAPKASAEKAESKRSAVAKRDGREAEKPAVELVRSAPPSEARSAATDRDGEASPVGSELPVTPCGTSSPAVAHVDAPSKKLIGITEVGAAGGSVPRAGTAVAVPAGHVIAAASLPCTSPD